MAPKSGAFRHLQKRMRRTLNYGSRRMQNLPLPLSELVVDYFDKRAPYDYMSMDFATSLARDGCVDACAFLVAMVYVDRVRMTDKTYFESSDPKDIYLSALVVASKFLHDGGLEEFVYNDEWAASASTSLNRVNELELKMLDILSWNVSVDAKEFEKALYEAECWVAINGLSKRGFFAYNEATVLSSKVKFLENILLPLLCVFASVVIIYIAFLVPLLIVPKVVVNHKSSLNESQVERHLKDYLSKNDDCKETSYYFDSAKSLLTNDARDQFRCGTDRQFSNNMFFHNLSNELMQLEFSNRIIPAVLFCSFT